MNDKKNTKNPINQMIAPRYMDIPTFMRAPLLKSFSDVDIAMIGIPYDGAVSNRAGARHGPREIRNASSMMRAIHHVSKINPYEICRIGDAGDVPLSRVYDVEATHHEIARFFSQIHKAGIIPLSVGGDHSITLPILRALAEKNPVGLIHIDAHTDTWDEFMECKFMHGAPFRRAVEENLIDPRRTVQIGIRGAQNTTEGWDFSLDNGMRVIFMEEFYRLGVEKIITEVRQIVGKGSTYISFDVDALDPAFAPGTGTPEIGGMSPIEAQILVRGFRGLHLIGGDVVEVAPPFDLSGNTALIGATIMYELLCLLAETAAAL